MTNAIFLNSNLVESLAEAVALAYPHDEIRIQGEVTLTDSLHTNAPITFTGIGNDATISARGLLRGGRGIFCTNNDTVISNISFQRAATLTGNGAGVWHEGGTLRLENCRFVENQNGVMIAGLTDAVVISNCEFISNGSGCGHTHGVYISAAEIVTVERCSFYDTNVGHHLKSRAAETTIQRCYFGSSSQGTTSYSIDISNGGRVLISENQFIKGRNSMSWKFISYCAEGDIFQPGSANVISNIFINHRKMISVAVANYSRSTPILMSSNACEGVTFSLVGRGSQKTKIDSQMAIAAGAWRAFDAKSGIDSKFPDKLR